MHTATRPQPDEFTADELRILHAVARALLTEGEYGELLAALLDALIQAFAADRGCMVVREDDDFHAAVARNFQQEPLALTEEAVSKSIAEAVMQSGEAILIGDATQAVSFRDKSSVQRMGIRSVLCAPVIATDEAFALVYLENRSLPDCFSERQRRLLSEICALAAPRLRTAVAVARAQQQARELRSYTESDGFVVADPAMAALLQTVHQVAPTDLPVLIQGETGTGKELIARALYRNSKRASGPFITLNCAAIPATLIESELFGYTRGAFTGATRDRIGMVGAAHRGTLFLDEIGELPLELQGRLLRVLQSGEFQRLGSVQPESVDVRFIAATNRDLPREIEGGRFRQDLYYRLSAVTLEVPPLRDRMHDLPLLVEHFLRLYGSRYGKSGFKISDECLHALQRYSFPGNIRELQNELARCVALSPSGTVISVDALNDRIRKALTNNARSDAAPVATASDLPPMSLAAMEKRLILAVLESTSGNRTRAAEVLGISREGLRLKMQRLGLSDGG